jgi:hypothetical protein
MASGLIAVRFELLSRININWDEFLYLSRVHAFDRGELTSAFLTFHVQLFQWLVAVPGNEIDQMIAARYSIFVLRIATTVLVFLLGLRLGGRSAGLVAAVASLGFTYVIRHGESFRADPLIAFLFLLCAALMAWRRDRPWAVTAAAAAFALGAAISVKMAVYVPALAGFGIVGLWTSGDVDRRRGLRDAAIFVTVSAATFLALTLWHAAATSAPESEVARRGIASGAGMLGNPQLHVFTASLRSDAAFWALFVIGIVFAARNLLRKGATRDARGSALLLFALLTPLTSLLIYRNTFEYFYVALVPLASLACGYAAACLEHATPGRLRGLVPVIVAVPMALRGWSFSESLQSDGIAPQRQVVAAVHAIFPEPVPYLDRCGMISSFPRAPLFMSTYVLQAYRREGVPRMARMVADEQPRFLLANVSGLALDRSWDTVSTYERRLLREDFEFLQANFIPHWGPIWVPGKRLILAPGADGSVTTIVAGPYTVEDATSPVYIDGVPARANDVVMLEPGAHRVRGAGTVTLRYGARLRRPKGNPPFQPLFRDLDR